jgi:hypothetical protein
VGLIVHFGVSESQNVDTLFFRIGWTRCGFRKKRAGMRYIELVFLLQMRSAGHVVHSGVSGV